MIRHFDRGFSSYFYNSNHFYFPRLCSDEQKAQVTSQQTATPGTFENVAEIESASISAVATAAAAAVPNPPSSDSDNATALVATTSNPPLTSPTQNSTREELIEVYVPAGKLGFTLEDSQQQQQQQQGESSGGPPVIHEVRTMSILTNTLQVGDRLIAFDDEDVRQMSAQQVSRMISRKFDSTTRKLSIVRTVPVVPDDSL